MSAHTAGPWTDAHPFRTPVWTKVRATQAHGDFEFASIGIGQGNKFLARVEGKRGDVAGVGYPHVDDMDELFANARLIASAPDLLAALQKILDYEDELLATLTGMTVVAHARLAIAKAVQS